MENVTHSLAKTRKKNGNCSMLIVLKMRFFKFSVKAVVVKYVNEDQNTNYVFSIDIFIGNGNGIH